MQQQQKLSSSLVMMKKVGFQLTHHVIWQFWTQKKNDLPLSLQECMEILNDHLSFSQNFRYQFFSLHKSNEEIDP